MSKSGANSIQFVAKPTKQSGNNVGYPTIFTTLSRNSQNALQRPSKYNVKFQMV